MPTDRSAEPWAGSIYKGFSGGPTVPPPDEQPAEATHARRRLNTPALMVMGVAAAVALGLGFGFLARPELGGRSTAQPAATSDGPQPEATPDVAQVPIAVAPQARSEPARRASGKLETLPPDTTAAQAAGPAQPQPAPRDEAATNDGDNEDEAAATPSMVIEPSAPAPSAAQDAEPVPPLRASFDCATARPGAEQMVCSDPELAADDRRLARAYRRALRSGVDPYDLRQEQRDWMGIREDAARHSRRDLAQVYDQRIQELNQMADQGPPGPDGDDNEQ